MFISVLMFCVRYFYIFGREVVSMVVGKESIVVIF